MPNSRSSSADACSDGKLSGRAALAASPTVARWLAALAAGEDLGHFGRLAFVSAARHFLTDSELVLLLAGQPRHDAGKVLKLVDRVRERGYAPPSRPRLLQWQARQRYPLLENPADPTVGNLYRELSLPDGVFSDIETFWSGPDDLPTA